MEYITREMERKFLSMSSAFKAIMLTGARQVGKSTMLKKLAENTDRTIISLDNAEARELAQRDPRLFFQMYKPPILIDEVQKAPEIFEMIKIICDETDEKGLFWLTGSESKKLLSKARDSLAGRVCLLRMYSLSQREKLGLTALGTQEFNLEKLIARKKHFPDNNVLDVYEHIWRGGMPGTMHMNEEQLLVFYESYIDTYLMRDAVEDNGVANNVGFRKALRACAAFAGNLLNYSDIATAANVTVNTAKDWIKILQTMGIIFLLEPFSNNELKRLTKTPKLYFCDTGLCAYLSKWPNKDTLLHGASNGHYFENYVLGEMLRGYTYGTQKVNVSFYRDSNQQKIDVIVEEGGQLHPIEIKLSANPDRRAVKRFQLLCRGPLLVGTGGIICMVDKPFVIDENNMEIPCNII